MIKNLNQSVVLLTTILFWISLAQAQESINTSGGDASGSSGTVAYSVGQVVYTTNTASNGSAAQGVQQAYEIYSLAIKEVRTSISVDVFPNPTTSNLTLQINEFNNQRYSYQLYDILGKALKKGEITSQQTQINTSGLPSATYILHIQNEESQKVQSFKVIKTQ
ncbi:T9SS type A sorting domain-containing protein [Psychroflexus salis]|uniref:T9SS type A sorting domain-containing protein n=1 Tax=Psychroflexus salis TaxID=1526574 RepID=UPI00166D72F6|nr:T9SS type A sorting domain-containing protein [Psychroflexus salis]